MHDLEEPLEISARNNFQKTFKRVWHFFAALKSKKLSIFRYGSHIENPNLNWSKVTEVINIANSEPFSERRDS